jgi:hypothetical protein
MANPRAYKVFWSSFTGSGEAANSGVVRKRIPMAKHIRRILME